MPGQPHQQFGRGARRLSHSGSRCEVAYARDEVEVMLEVKKRKKLEREAEWQKRVDAHIARREEHLKLPRF